METRKLPITSQKVNGQWWHVKYERSKMECEGCKEEFDCLLDRKRGRLYGFNQFYRHCIYQCVKYQRKQKIKLCMKCNNLFINKLEIAEHHNQCPSHQHVSKGSD